MQLTYADGRREQVSSYKGLRENEARGPSIVNSIVSSARVCNLDKVSIC